MESNRIPKIIHYCWFGNGEMSEQEKNCIASWKKYCPDYTFMEWNDSNYDIGKCRYTKEAAENGKWSFVTDYVRLDVLYEHGGIYLDTDVEIVKSFDSLLSHEAFIGFETEEIVNNGQGMGTVPHFFMWKDLLEEYNELSFYKEDGSLNLKECTRYLTAYLVKHGLRTDGSRQTVEGLEVFPVEYFCPKSFLTGKIKVTENTYSIHHFRGAWHSEKERKIIKGMQFVRRVLGERLGSRVLEAFFKAKDAIRHKT